jgi:hypothetical protein
MAWGGTAKRVRELGGGGIVTVGVHLWFQFLVVAFSPCWVIRVLF